MQALLRTLALEVSLLAAIQAIVFGVRCHGAEGDGRTTGTAAVDEAKEAAAGAGGGTVSFPAGFGCR